MFSLFLQTFVVLEMALSFPLSYIPKWVWLSATGINSWFIVQSKSGLKKDFEH